MKEPLFSIIVPVYKTDEGYLRECIDSILNQTVSDFELILIDDGSPDRCGEICDEYSSKDSRVRTFHIENGGVAAARNTGIAKARGEWITFIDSDDWIEKNTLETVINSSEDNIDIIIWNLVKDGKNAQYKNTYFEEESRYFREDEKRILQIHAIWVTLLAYRPRYNTVATACGKAYRRQLFKNEYAKYPLDMKVFEDAILNTYMFEYARSVKYISDYLYHYRVVPESASHKPRAVEQQIEIKHRVADEVRLFMDRFGESELIMKGYYARLFDELYTIYTLKKPGPIALRRLSTGDRYAEMIENISTEYIYWYMHSTAQLLKEKRYIRLYLEIKHKKLISKAVSLKHQFKSIINNKNGNKE